MEAGLTKRPAYLIYHWFWKSLDWVYPPACGGCGERGNRWCLKCQNGADQLGIQVCLACGYPSRTLQGCLVCHGKKSPLKALRSWAFFSGSIREALHRLKYKRDMALGEALAQPLIGLYNTLGWGADMILPVPLSSDRLNERGYNQAAFLAQPIALACGVTYASHALKKIRNTPSQVGLSSHQRRENVSGAFWADRACIRGKRVVIVDDLMTTGATLEACGQALLDAGASVVWGLTLARAYYEPAGAIHLSLRSNGRSSE
jgi:competence protein ComFC